MGLRDIRIPADPEDKQTTDARSALPPVEFTVTRGTSANLITIRDRQAPQNRYPTVSYRVYFLPSEFSPKPVGITLSTSGPSVVRPAIRAAGKNVASLVADISAPALGTILTHQDTTNFQKTGYYYCVGVNRVGVEAPPEHFVSSP